MRIYQGIDFVKVDRIKKVYSKFSNRFLSKIFSDRELSQINMVGDNLIVNKIAGKFSAKEAAVKALGTGFSSGITFKSIEIINHENGRPTIILKGKAKKILKDLISSNVSISNDGGFVVTVVTFLTRN